MMRIELESPVTGVVWKVSTPPGTSVVSGDTVVVVESMKMEIPIEATEVGVVAEVLVSEGDRVSEGDPVALLETT
jgi:biotin carboxyl carrier protein